MRPPSDFQRLMKGEGLRKSFWRRMHWISGAAPPWISTPCWKVSDAQDFSADLAGVSGLERASARSSCCDPTALLAPSVSADSSQFRLVANEHWTQREHVLGGADPQGEIRQTDHRLPCIVYALPPAADSSSHREL